MSVAWWYPSPRQGLLIEDARTWRVRLADGAVEVHHDGGRVETLARPGEVSRVVVLSSRQAGRLTPDRFGEVVAVLADGEPVLALAVSDLSSGAAVDDAQARAAAGLVEGAAALGLVVEAASDEESSVVRRTGLRRPDAMTSARRDQAVQSALLVLATVCVVLVVVVGPYSSLWRPASLLAGVLLLGIGIRRTMLRRRLSRLWPAPDAAGRVEVPRSQDRLSDGRTFLQIGGEEVVLGLMEEEHWVAGPSRGGVTECRLTPSGLVLADGQGEIRLVAPDRWSRDDVEPACREAGLSVSTSTDPLATSATDSVEQLIEVKTSAGAWPFLQGVANGDASRLAVLVAPVVAAVLAVISLVGPDVDLDLSSASSGVLALVSLGLFGWLEVDRRRQSRRLVGR